MGVKVGVLSASVNAFSFLLTMFTSLVCNGIQSDWVAFLNDRHQAPRIVDQISYVNLLYVKKCSCV